MKKQKMLSNQEMIVFCDQMSMVLKAGLTPAAGIELMLEDADSKDGQAILLPIAEKCNEGYTFPQALAASEVFPAYALHMIEIGNASGNLDEVMDSLVYHYTREENIRQGIRSAVTYPFLIIFMMMIVILVLVIKVLPIFRQIFIQLGSEIPSFSIGLMDFGSMLTRYSMIFIAVFFVLLIGCVFFTQSRPGKKMFSAVCSKFFLTKGIYEKIASARFASGMAITVAAGLDTETSLDMVEKLVDNPAMALKVKKCRELMAGSEGQIGLPFNKALVASSIFSNIYSKMIEIGFATGSIDQVFRKIADSYDQDIEKRISNTISILEPTLVILLSIVVCLILLSVIMPLMGIMSSIG